MYEYYFIFLHSLDSWRESRDHITCYSWAT